MYDSALIPFTHTYFATPLTCYIIHNNHQRRPHGCNSDILYNVRMIVFNQASTFSHQRLRLFLCECFFTRFHCYSNIHRLINSFVNHSKEALSDRRIIENEKSKESKDKCQKKPTLVLSAQAHAHTYAHPHISDYYGIYYLVF